MPTVSVAAAFQLLGSYWKLHPLGKKDHATCAGGHWVPIQFEWCQGWVPEYQPEPRPSPVTLTVPRGSGLSLPNTFYYCPNGDSCLIKHLCTQYSVYSGHRLQSMYSGVWRQLCMWWHRKVTMSQMWHHGHGCHHSRGHSFCNIDMMNLHHFGWASTLHILTEAHETGKTTSLLWQTLLLLHQRFVFLLLVRQIPHCYLRAAFPHTPRNH